MRQEKAGGRDQGKSIFLEKDGLRTISHFAQRTVKLNSVGCDGAVREGCFQHGYIQVMNGELVLMAPLVAEQCC